MSDTDDKKDKPDKNENDPVDPPRETTPGRGQGQGSWFEECVAETLSEWGYKTKTRVELLALEADIIARRKQLQNKPDDFLVVQCKDWERRPIGKQTIIRLCLVAFIARASPVLCHTSRLSQQAWELAQAYDVRLVSLEGLSNDQLPPLTTFRPPSGTTPHRQERLAESFRSHLPPLLCRSNPLSEDQKMETPTRFSSHAPPCYVADRTGHMEYVSSTETDYDFHHR